MIDILLNKYNINKKNISILLDNMLDKKIDFGDIYFQSKEQEIWVLENKIIKKGTYFFDEGVGIRAIKNTSTSFSYTNSIKLNNLNNSIDTVCKMLSNVKTGNIINKQVYLHSVNAYSSFNLIDDNYVEKKIYILNYIDNLARSQDYRVIDVQAVLTCEQEEILVGSTDSMVPASDARSLVYITIEIIVEQNNKREKGFHGGGGRFKINDFFKKKTNNEMLIDFWTKEAVRIALTTLSAKISPAGSFPVVLGPGWPGILFHEAVGHGLEGDFIRKKTSIFTKKIGQKVASNLCTIVDNGTLHGSRGSVNIDDEGTPGQYNILIKNGVLKSFLQDKLNAHVMYQKSTGNGRRESYAHLPMPRMTNTYLLSGSDNHLDIINSVDYGIYAVNFSGGQVDITSGNFVFSTSEAYLIKNGKIFHPLKGATLIGSGIEVMKSISMVGNNLQMASGLGNCGKNGQTVPVNVGQPTIKVDKMTISGTC
ncbi:Metalloprotease TldD [Buchnera aphidicola (Cinara kochiana kochiana)]|uniref:Metalloprotease TldD n=1 Tax=Buchnera aphidicola (Cinara kochiana kochiana) TaxID=2518976 RepID=A0A451D5R7_9GAMM|nr:metalloprotease TldD [Buchnera aphidicola]VFP81168.1 Metalloprotease TldD [Buchnera aphidicola (Cinara kochiana kochiana)]